MRSRVLVAILAVTMLALLANAAGARGPTATTSRHCPTFTGPGDNLVHSQNFQAVGVSCALAKRVVEHCGTRATACSVAGYLWRCSGRIPGTERCMSGRKVASIDWAD